jgi:thymidylate synthase (FAD)
MNTKLIAITPDAEKIIAYCARVTSDNQTNPEIRKLLSYCIEHKHWSPFEHASMTVEINTSRAIARQILRHRSFCFQEFSQRYAENLNFEPVVARRQAEKNRQSSINDLDDFTQNNFQILKENLEISAETAYRKAIADGVAKETARFLLPECTTSRLYMTGNIRSWLHYTALRGEEDTQAEHRDIAEQIKEIMCFEMPTIGAVAWQH